MGCLNNRSIRNEDILMRHLCSPIYQISEIIDFNVMGVSRDISCQVKQCSLERGKPCLLKEVSHNFYYQSILPDKTKD